MSGGDDDANDPPRTVFAAGGGGGGGGGRGGDGRDEDGDRTVFDPGGSSPDPAAGAGANPGAGIKAGDVLNHMFGVRRFLARGGMGEVFEGTNLATDERVAIKVMLPALAADPNVITLFKREAQTLTRLHHEAVVQYRVLAMEPELGVLYIVTEYIDGTSLSDRLSNLNASAADLGQLLRRLASGLAAAHRLGAVHRDVSPDNVLLGGGELSRAKLIDFGIAKDLDAGTATIVGDGFAGKLGYVAPEQLGDYNRALGPWTDVYSLGLVIIAVARGGDVGLGGTLVDAVDKRRAGVDLSAVPLPLRNVVERMVRPDPTERMRDMDAVLAALDAAEVPGAAAPRPPLAWIAAALVGAVVIAGIAFWLLSGRSDRAPGQPTAARPNAAVTDVQRARYAIDATLPSVNCTWLQIVDVTQGPGGLRVALTGVAGDPGAAQEEISRALKAENLLVGNIDSSEVASITQSGCAALDAFRQIRSTGSNRLTVPFRRFEMKRQGADDSFRNKLAANAVIGIAIGDPGTDFALLGLEPSGKIDQVFTSRRHFAEELRQSKNDIPIKDLGNDRYRLGLDLDHTGWSGLLLVTGKGPFDLSVLAPPLGSRGPEWRNRLATMAAERGWRTDMVWFQSVDEVPD